MIMTTRPDQGEGRDALRKQLSDFIEVLNNVLPADVTEVISITFESPTVRRMISVPA